MGQQVSKGDVDALRSDMKVYARKDQIPKCAKKSDLPSDLLRRSEIPNVAIYALKSDLPTNYLRKSELPNFSQYAQKAEVPQDFVLRDDLPNLSNLISKGELAGMTNMNDYITKGDFENLVKGRSMWCSADGSTCAVPAGKFVQLGNRNVIAGDYRFEMNNDDFGAVHHATNTPMGPKNNMIQGYHNQERFKKEEAERLLQEQLKREQQEKALAAARAAEAARLADFQRRRDQWARERPSVRHATFETDCQGNHNGLQVCHQYAAQKGQASYWLVGWDNCSSCGCSWKAGCLCGRKKFQCVHDFDRLMREWQAREPRL